MTRHARPLALIPCTHARLLAVVPCTIFLLLSFVSVCALLLQVLPRSMFLWWVNIEVFSAFRLTFYVLDYLVTRSPLAEASVLIAACAFTFLAARARNLAALFLLNHLATLLIISSLIAQYAHPATADLGASFRPVFVVLFHITAFQPLPFTLALLGILSCGATHLKFFGRITRSA